MKREKTVVEDFQVTEMIVYPTLLNHHANSHWSIELSIDLEVKLPDGRIIYIDRRLINLAAMQQGRKPRKRKALPVGEETGRLMESGDKG